MSGVYYIDPDGLGEFKVFCDQTTAGGGWTVFQKRFDGTVDFFRTWDDYRQGFGNLNGEFWLGLDKIYRLTASSSNKLRVDLEDVRGGRAFCRVPVIFCGQWGREIFINIGKLFRCDWTFSQRLYIRGHIVNLHPRSVSCELSARTKNYVIKHFASISWASRKPHSEHGSVCCCGGDCSLQDD